MWLLRSSWFLFAGKAENYSLTRENKQGRFIHFLVLVFCALLIAGDLDAQCYFQDSLNKKIPIYLEGDTNKFKITESGLQSFSEETKAHSFEVFVDCNGDLDSFIWEFDLELNLNTSSQNRFCFGLMHKDSQESFFQMGNTNDQLEFVDLNSNRFLGTENTFNQSNTHVFIQIIKIQSQLTIRIFPSILTNPTTYNLTLTNPHTTGIFWRVHQSGKSAFGKHLIRNIKLQPIWSQYQITRLLHAHIIRNGLLSLEFSHPVILNGNESITINQNRAQNIKYFGNYQTLFMESSKFNGDSIFVSLDSLNTIYNQYFDTTFSIAAVFPQDIAYGDLRFSEVFFDATPSYGILANTEYIEIQNCRMNWLDLSNLILVINGKEYNITLPHLDTFLFLLLTPSCGDFPQIPCFEIPFNLRNEENQLCLKTAEGSLLDSISVQNKLHHPLFYDGGVSLEAPTDNTPFSECFEWYSHLHNAGSPGQKPQQRSRASPKKPLQELQCVYHSSQLTIEFSENLKPQQWIYIWINNKIDSIYYTSGKYTTTSILSFVDSCEVQFINRHEDTVRVKRPVFKNTSSSISITEIHFEAPYNADFIEIQNTGYAALQFKDIDVLIYDKNDRIKHIIPCFQAGKKWIFPGETIAISGNSGYWVNIIDSTIPKNILELSVFPNLTTEGGFIEIVHHLYGRLDKAPFHREMHTQNANYKSLEKRTANLPSAFEQNWMTANYQSSVASPSIPKTTFKKQNVEKMVALERRTWFANSEDLPLGLQFNFPTEGYYVYASMYDSWGNPLGMIIDGLQMPQKAYYPLLLEDFPNTFQSGNYVIKFAAFHLASQHRMSQVERISFIYE